jgi:copper chaperone CopZ
MASTAEVCSNQDMRWAILLLAAAVSANAEFRQIDIDFEGTGCASCAESLPERLKRVRGVESATVDLGRSRVSVHFEPGNKARLAPVVSRITQDGTKIRRVETVARGKITRQGDNLVFELTGSSETYQLRPAEGAPPLNPKDGLLYDIQGVLSGIEPGAETILEAQSMDAVSGGTR